MHVGEYTCRCTTTMTHTYLVHPPCMQAGSYILSHARLHPCVHLPIHPFIHPSIPVCLHACTNMFICVCACKYVCTYVAMCTCIYVCMDVDVITCICFCVRKCTHICSIHNMCNVHVHVHVYLRVYVCIYSCTAVCMYVCMHGCMYVCMRVQCALLRGFVGLARRTATTKPCMWHHRFRFQKVAQTVHKHESRHRLRFPKVARMPRIRHLMSLAADLLSAQLRCSYACMSHHRGHSRKMTKHYRHD